MKAAFPIKDAAFLWDIGIVTMSVAIPLLRGVRGVLHNLIG